MRVGGDSTKLKNLFKKFCEDIQISKQYFKYYFTTVIFKILRKIPQITLF